MSQIGLTPPPPGYFRLFWISDLFEKCWSPLSDQFQTFLNLRTYWWRKTPWTNILKGLFRHIYIEKGQIKCFNISFLGWGLKVTYNSDIFEKLRPPPWIFKCPNLNFRHFFLTRPPYFGKCQKFTHFLIMRPPLSQFTIVIFLDTDIRLFC